MFDEEPDSTAEIERLRALVKDAARDMTWMAQTGHDSHHDAPGGWKHCNKGICASMNHMLRTIGFDKDLNPVCPAAEGE